MSKYLFTVCGRAGSKGIPGKNSALFLGIPLLYYTLATIELYRESHLEDEVDLALNTDSADLKRLMDESGIKYVFIPRSKALAGDSVGKVDVIRETYRSMKEINNSEYDAVIDLDLTAPLRTLNDLERVLDKRKRTDLGVVFTVVPSRRNPYFNMVIENPDGSCSKVNEYECMSRQQAPSVYDINASIYAYSIEFMDSDRQMFDAPCQFVEMYDTAVLDLDHSNDLELMQVIAEYLYSKNESLRVVRERARRIAEATYSQMAEGRAE